MPSWSGLTHFDQVASVDFTDATKLEDIVKVSLFFSKFFKISKLINCIFLKISLFVCHDLVDSKFDEASILISCLRAYLNLFMYTGFQVHTTETIQMGRDALSKFSALMTVEFNYFHVSEHVLNIIATRNIARIQHFSQKKLGIYQKCTHMFMLLMILWKKE